MSFPPLADWRDTCESLHLYSNLLGAVRASLTDPHPLWWHVSLRCDEAGLTTGENRLPGGESFALGLDLEHHRLTLTAGGETRSLADLRNGPTGRELGETALATLAELGPAPEPDRARWDNDGARIYRAEDAVAYRGALWLTEPWHGALLPYAAVAGTDGVTRANELVELGSGTARKTRTLIAALLERDEGLHYAPLEISDYALEQAASAVTGEFPAVRVTPIVCGYTRNLDALDPDPGCLAVFLGSTIGNFTQGEGVALLRRLRDRLAPGDFFLLGLDQVKPVGVLEAAYNDSAGLTAEFNRNILNVINAEVDGDFDPGAYDHLAFFDRAESRIEMHLVARTPQTARLEALGLDLEIAAAERTRDYAAAAALYFGDEDQAPASVAEVARRIFRWTSRHLQLVAVSLLLAIAVGVPLGIRAARPGLLSQVVLGSVGVIYTIPSLALLAVLVAVPFLGISSRTAIVALFLYSLLPTVRNTAAGLGSISPEIRESAAALGLEPSARLRKVLLPLALPTSLAGIKTSAVINVGAATLAALIGAGGLGEPILSGLNLNDPGTILQGAVPGALLALAVQLGFDRLERAVVPRGLRLDRATE